MKKLIPLFLAAIMLLCNIFAGNALAANETAPETRSIPTGVASATPHETDLFFFDEGVDPQAASLFTRHDITFSSHGPNAARVTVNLETADNVKKLVVFVTQSQLRKLCFRGAYVYTLIT